MREQASNVEFGGGAVLPDGIPQQISDEIIGVAHRSVTKASRTAIIFAAAFGILAFLMSFLLPRHRREEKVGESIAVK